MSQPNDGKPRATTPGNAKMLGDLQQIIKGKLDETMRPGFYGEVAITLAVTDGNLRTITEQVKRTHQ